jgi:hypothetical protein
MCFNVWLITRRCGRESNGKRGGMIKPQKIIDLETVSVQRRNKKPSREKESIMLSTGLLLSGIMGTTCITTHKGKERNNG